MRIIERTETTQIREVCTAVICDVCKKKYPPGWVKLPEVCHTDVRVETGTAYPSGGSMVVYSVDICPQCFESVLMPMLEKMGAEFTKCEVDY